MNTIQYLQVFCFGVFLSQAWGGDCFSGDMELIRELLFFVYTSIIQQKMLSYYGEQIISLFFLLSVFHS